MFYCTCLVVSPTHQQPKEKTVSTEDDDSKRQASPSTDANVPSPVKTVETDDASFPSDDIDLKKHQKEVEHSDVTLDKSAGLSAGSESVISEKDTKEDNETTSQIKTTETVSSTEATWPQQSGVLLHFYT